MEFIIGSDGWLWEVDAQGKGKKVDPPYKESLPRIRLGVEQLTTKWQTFQEPLLYAPQDPRLKRVICPFGWVILPGKLEGQKYAFEVRNIRFQRTPWTRAIERGAGIQHEGIR